MAEYCKNCKKLSEELAYLKAELESETKWAKHYHDKLEDLKKLVERAIFKPENLKAMDSDGAYYILAIMEELKELQKSVED